MNYGQAIEAMKKGGFVSRLKDPLESIALAHADTPQRYFERRTGKHSEPFRPSVGDQLAEDWYPSGGVVSAELATTTFGPLAKYVAANDNVPQSNDKLRRLFKGQLTEGEKADIDDAMCGGPQDGPAADYNGMPAGEWKASILKDVEERFGPLPDDLVDFTDAAWPLSSDNGQYIGLTRNQPAEGRAGSFMQTYTGRQYWPMDPRPHEVHIEDIAHSLAMQARYAGHCIKFYSVAEHSVLIARHLAAKHAPEVALAGLLHDAPEAYCVDIPRPLKPYLTNYRAIEQDNWLAIAARFQIDRDLPDEVHDADNRIIADELVNLREMPWHAKHDRPLGVKLRYWSPEEAELEFLATFDALMAGRE